MGQLIMLIVGATISAYGRGYALLAMSWALFALGTGTGIALIRRAAAGYYLLYFCALVSMFGPRINFVPLVHRILPAGPETDYYAMAVNLVVVTLAMWCHWSVTREDEEPAPKRHRIAIAASIFLIIAGVIFWKTGIRTGNGEVARVAETPFIGSYLAPLESTQTVLYRSLELRRLNSGTVIFRGMTSEANVKEFAATHKLTEITNFSARAKFLPLVKTWKLDRERFPVFTQPGDLCYIGRIPKGSKLAVQICHRPSDGRFTAMAMGSPTAK